MITDWTPHTDADKQRRCQNCDAAVTKRFARVFGDNEDIVHACPSCTSYREMTTAAADAGGGGL